MRGLETTLFDGCVGDGGREPLDQRLGRLRMHRRCGNARRKHDDFLSAERQWAHDVDSLYRAQFADLLKANLKFSCRDYSADRVRLDFPALGLDLVADSQL